VSGGERGWRPRELLERAAQIAALWGLAVVLPLFGLLGDHPEFFSARGSRGGDIVVFALAVTVIAPLLLLFVQWLAGLLSRAAAWWLQLGYVAVLVAAIVLQLLPFDALAPSLALAVLAGAAAAAAYARAGRSHWVLTVLWPVPFVFLGIFLVLSDASPLAEGEPRAPVVLVIFDELPVQSLMDADGRIDARRYPNFARLAADATWYRDTASVDQDTPYAVPAILDGRLPRQERLPVAADHPQNIFSLLDGRYELHAREDGTTLCAPELCAAAAHEGFGERLRSLSGDAAGGYAHLLLPDRVDFDPAPDTAAAVAENRRTQRESKRHRYRRLHANLAAGRPQRFEDFVAAIEGGSRPRLHLIHILLPHVPFQYLPSGRRYRTSPREALPGLEGRPGYSVPFLVKQSYARHLLQVGATDRLLGTLLDRLRDVGIYDRALVAVVADHGISFRRRHDRRLVRAANVEEIAPVPFFLKAPGQRTGRISDKPLRTVDVLPTVADILGVRIPWRIDGRSARASTIPAQRERRIIAKKYRHVYPVDTPSYQRERRAALARKLSLFGDDIYAFGPRPDLLGRRLTELSPLPATGERALVARPERYRDVDPDSGFMPVRIVGRIEPGRRGGGRVLVVALNGTVAATGRTFTLEGSEAEQFSVLIPERRLRRGANRVELLLASGRRIWHIRS
jgi:Sulfatase